MIPRRFHPRSDFRSRFFAFFALAAIALIFDGRYLGSQLVIGVDHTLQQIPWLSSRWHGGLPLWDPYTLSGVPAYDNLQIAMLYPARWPFFFIADWRSYYGIYLFLHYPIALAGAYLLARAWRMRLVSALAVAILFACGGHMAGRPLNPVLLYSTAWLPWLLYGASGVAPRHRWATTASLALILSIGSPHLFLYGLIGYTIVALSVGLRPVQRHPKISLFKNILSRVLHLAAGFALAAPSLVPGLLRVGSSVRAEGDVLKNLEASVGWNELGKLFLGGTGGAIYPEYIDKSVFIGAAAALLILLSLLRRRSWRERRVQCALMLTLTGLVLALGKNIGWDRVIASIPGLQWMTAPDRALGLAAIGAALLCGLAMDALNPAVARRSGWIALPLAVISAALSASAFSANLKLLLTTWFKAPEATGGAFVLIDSCIAIAAAALLFLLLRRRTAWLRIALLLLISFQCLHFAPRVLPPMRPRSFYDATPAVHFLQAQARRQIEPFRIMGYDPLRVHDMDVDNRHVVDFLVPQLASLFDLQDVQGFDPLIPEVYANLIDRTSGRAPFNDPIRCLDLAWPDPDLLKLLGVRYLLGHPYDRRVTNLPATLAGGQIIAEVKPIPQKNGDSWPRKPVTDWLFISLIDGKADLPFGAQVAMLHVEAEEGVFDFPIRNGIESAWINALNFPQLFEDPDFHAVVNTQWEAPTPNADLGYHVKQANWRGRVAFGRPLNVRHVSWILTDPDCILFIAAQACRLASPGENSWRLAFGLETDAAPVYEFLAAAPRAALAPLPVATSGAGNALLAPPSLVSSAQSIRWLDWQPQSMRLEAATTAPSLLFLRERWDAGWQATVGGRPTPLRQAGPLYSGIDLPGGKSIVEMRYRPRLPWILIFICWPPVAIAGAVSFARRQRAKRQKTQQCI